MECKNELVIRNLYQRYDSQRTRCGKKGTAYEFTYFGFDSFEEFLEDVAGLKREVVNGVQCYSFKDFYEDPRKYDLDKDLLGLGYVPGGIRILTVQSNRHGVAVFYRGIEYPSIISFKKNCPLPEGVSREFFEYMVDKVYGDWRNPSIRDRNWDTFYGSKIQFVRKGFTKKNFSDYYSIVDEALKNA